MQVQERTLKQCTVACMKNIKCRSLNYNSADKSCELLDGKDKEKDMMLEKEGWWHYATPERGV